MLSNLQRLYLTITMDNDSVDLVVAGEMTLAFVLALPRADLAVEPDQAEFPWNVEILHEFMPLVDDIAIRLNLEHSIILMPDDDFVKIGFPPIPTFDMLDLVEYLDDQDQDWSVYPWVAYLATNAAAAA